MVNIYIHSTVRFLVIIALSVSTCVSWANEQMITDNVKSLDINTVDHHALEFTLSKRLHLAPKDNSTENTKNTAQKNSQTSHSSQNQTNTSASAPLQPITHTEYKYIPVYYPVKIPVYYPVYIPKYIPVSSFPNQP